jgi:hypothetical protein
MTRTERTTTTAHRLLATLGAILIVAGLAIALGAGPVPGATVVHYLVGAFVGAIGSASLVAAWRRWRAVDVAIILIRIGMVMAIVAGIGSIVQTALPALSSDPRIELVAESNANEFYAAAATDRPRDERDANDPVVAQGRDDVQGSLVLPVQSTVTVVVWDATPLARAAVVARALLAPALAVAALWLLHGILLATRDGDPFAPRNASRATWLGWLLLIGIPTASLFGSIGIGAAVGSQYGGVGPLPNNDGLFAFSLPLVELAPGFLVLALATAWRHGVQLRELEQATV